jgi:asparagine synthase (glutamine-hydrolysing)
MCGICGKINLEGVNYDDLQLMCDTISHRGPDDEGYYTNGTIGLGMRRLSIIDLDSGRQPISNEDETLWIVFNGEIYNYQSLRKELKDKGHEFKTHSDTEVIIHLYEDMGEKCVERLSGMFAFAIWDEQKKKLFLARDRIGQKPLYYTQNGTKFIFASEVKAILATKEVKREIDIESLHHYLSLRFIPSPGTMFQSIKKLPPAHYLIFQNGSVTISRYWSLSFYEKLNYSEREMIEILKEKLEEVVESHLVSDVPVGSFLSGGLDSSMIVAMMDHVTTNQFKTFSIGVSEQDFNELPYARMVAEHYDTCHFEESVKSDLIRLLPKIIWHMDEPSDPIAACMFHASKLASQHVKVVLGGDGGDEAFAGFDRYLGVNYIDRYNLIPGLIRQRMISPFLDAIPDSFTYKSLTQKLRWINQLSSLSSVGERYAEATMFFRFNEHDKQLLFGESLWHQLENLNSADVIIQQYNHANANDPIDRMLYTDFMTRLPEHSLMLTDRMTMAHSLEARSPFLDHKLVEVLASFPSNMKIRDRELKYLLRKVAEGYLPKEITQREKQGFMFPIAYWFKSDLYDFIKQILLNSSFVRDGFFRRERVSKLIEDHRRNKVDNHVRLWMLLNLQIWYWLYIDQYEIQQVEDMMQYYLPGK